MSTWAASAAYTFRAASVLFVNISLLSAAAALLAAVPGNASAAYTVAYEGRTYDPNLFETTFCYTVHGDGLPPGLSHFAIQVPQCEPPLDVTDVDPEQDGSETDAAPEIADDPSTGYGHVIKWDFGLPEDGVRKYCFKVSGNVQEGSVLAIIKAGLQTPAYSVDGPSCVVCVQDAGASCTVGEGICETQGATLCDGACDAAAGQPDSRGELCGNGLDDDCDGETDEELCDACPDDPLKTAPGQCGCGIVDVDSDGDGTADCVDLCRDDPYKSDPGICGCAVADTDLDGDGAFDCQETCDNDPLKTEPGTCGCGTPDSDQDGDGAADCVDSCSEDPLKTAPGICGCAVADTDTDGDNAADCIESCDSDPSKTSPGFCGCGTPDVDSDGDGTLDCNDSCPSDADKVEAGICGCGVADVDANKDNVLDCICSAACDPTDPERDEDKDGVSNCIELSNGTAPCDSGSFIAKLKPSACAGPNGFFEQVNIATLVNNTAAPLQFRVEYRDLFGALKGTASFELPGYLKRDVIVNELGLERDTYGTVCIFTNAQSSGAWSGGLTIYKEEFADGTSGLGNSDLFDFALHYPFTNPQQGRNFVPLNTNVLGTDGLGTVANWIRLTDAVPGDGKGLNGALTYSNLEGKILAVEEVVLPDGGRFDYAGHEKLAFREVGLAEFIPASGSSEYYIEASRYFYRGEKNFGANFYTAFTVPNRPPTGAPTTGRVQNLADELSIVEITNGSDSPIFAMLKFFSLDGVQTSVQSPFLGAKGSFHQVVGGDLVAAGTISTAEASGPPESVSAATLIYRFLQGGELAFAYSPPFAQSAGVRQLTDWNSFLGQVNTVSIFNSSDKQITAVVSVLDYQGQPLPGKTLALGPRATEVFELAVPGDSYGTLIVDAGADIGLIVTNTVVRADQYAMPFPGR